MPAHGLGGGSSCARTRAGGRQFLRPHKGWGEAVPAPAQGLGGTVVPGGVGGDTCTPARRSRARVRGFIEIVRGFLPQERSCAARPCVTRMSAQVAARPAQSAAVLRPGVPGPCARRCSCGPSAEGPHEQKRPGEDRARRWGAVVWGRTAACLSCGEVAFRTRRQSPEPRSPAEADRARRSCGGRGTTACLFSCGGEVAFHRTRLRNRARRPRPRPTARGGRGASRRTPPARRASMRAPLAGSPRERVGLWEGLGASPSETDAGGFAR